MWCSLFLVVAGSAVVAVNDEVVAVARIVAEEEVVAVEEAWEAEAGRYSLGENST